MGQLLQIATARREAVLALLARYGAEEPRIFGSALRGEDGEHSDLDLLVRLPKSVSVFEVSRLQEALSGALQCEVDLVIEDELHPRIREQVLREARPL